MACSVVVLVLCVSIITTSDQGQMADYVWTTQGSSKGQCPSMEERGRVKSEIIQTVTSAISTIVTQLTNSTTIMTCGGPGWRRVAFINMTDTSYNCPIGLSLTSYSKRTCGRSHTTGGGCSSTTFSVGGLPYSRVCGRIRGYQFGATSAFWRYTQGIDSYYIDGVSLTHGAAGRRQHIWTFAAGATEVNQGSNIPEDCPCDAASYDLVPAFVGDDYFCESGLHSAWSYPRTVVFYPNDVLWDGQNCTSTSTCCQLNNPPWFTKNLTTETTDDIELRICTNDTPQHDDVPLELVELYVQ